MSDKNTARRKLTHGLNAGEAHGHAVILKKQKQDALHIVMVLLVDTRELLPRRLSLLLPLPLSLLFIILRIVRVVVSKLLRERELFFLHHLRNDPVVDALYLSEQARAEDAHLFVHGDSNLLADLQHSLASSSKLVVLVIMCRIKS